MALQRTRGLVAVRLVWVAVSASVVELLSGSRSPLNARSLGG